MKTEMYKEAVKELAIKDLTGLLANTASGVTVENWSSLRAPAKRDAFMEALTVSLELRKEFLDLYGTNHDQPENWINWELDTTEVIPAPEVDAADLADATTFNISKAGTLGTAFVDGDFEKIVSDAAGLDAHQSTSALVAVEDDLELSHMKIGILLSHISKSEHFLTFGHSNMREYIDAQTGLQYRKAMHLIQNAEAVRDLAITSDQLKGVSWSALRYILPVMDPSNYTHWLEAARSMKQAALKASVSEQKVLNAGALPPPDAGSNSDLAKDTFLKSFNVFLDQKEVIDQALAKAKVEGNTDSQGAALEVIAANYIGAPTTDATIGSVLPDLTDVGLKNMLSKIRADESYDGLIRVLNVIGEIFPEPEVTVEFPE